MYYAFLTYLDCFLHLCVSMYVTGVYARACTLRPRVRIYTIVIRIRGTYTAVFAVYMHHRICVSLYLCRSVLLNMSVLIVALSIDCFAYITYMY